MVMAKMRRAGLNWPQRGARVAGAGLLAVTGAIHLDLYLTGYRSIPVIGWLFLLQVIAAFGLAAAVLVSGSRLAAAAGAGFALSTLGGYLLSVQFGLSAAVPQAARHRTYAWLQAFAACRQKSRIRAGGVGPAISSWLSKMVTAPVDAVMCAAVPVPPTQP